MKNSFSNIWGLMLFMLLNTNMYSQEDVEIICQVIDRSSNRPIVYATVYLKNNRIGTISDENGNFRIPYEFKYQLDTLRVSSIGYATEEFPLTKLKIDELNVIFISPKIELLEEVVLVSKKNRKTSLSARKIIKNAIERIPINYPQESFSYIAYYRDYQQVLDSTVHRLKKNDFDTNYINLNEGIIKVFDGGFDTNKLMDDLNQTALYEFKINKDFPIDSSLAVPYDNRDEKYLEGIIISPLGGNELNILNLTNAIRNFDTMSFSFVKVLNKNFLANHTFKLVGITYFDDIPIYEIQFSLSARNSSFYRAEGTIFIAKNTFAIHKLTYNLYKKKKSDHLYAVNMEYVPFGEKYYLNYITFNNSFELKLKDYFKIIDVTYNFSNSYFRLSFSHNIDENSIKPWNKNFKIDYKNQRLKIINIQSISSKELKITVPNIYIDNRETFGENVRIKLKNIRDVNGNIIDDIPHLKVNQFREIFVQEVFPNSKLTEDLFFVRKNAPLADSKINSFIGRSHYWVNTPLKSNKMD